ncbi:excinuclease ABC subunit UvrC [Sulfobacillus harzensis]|uniref:UvrABC system protein C n=1 Tax=Sulfobacillus harzensis TaxID=2729629 RepID=A0A7Y0L3Z8_9FIRM|nr:excinuclease ABC subunit UvrC [Sulfobacillus harzensis]NMP22663.1 excinuclease ABC subunit UvrC [Sulfobacillus harzensis]
MRSPQLEEKLKSLPQSPGVYLMKDDDGQVLYVGKAVVLKNRVRSYFQDSARLAPKVRAMMRHVMDMEYIATTTEVEALILEATLIKQMKPHYNIRLKDDKAYPYLRLTWEEDFPRLLIARKPAEDGSRYFGPYPRAQAVRDTIRLLRKIFPIRNCTNPKFRNAARPCLEYHIGHCQAPCQGWVDKETYRATMKQVERFLEGRQDEVEKDLVRRLNAAAENLEFEKAAELRNQVQAIREVREPQKVAAGTQRELDAIHWALRDDEALVQIFRVRQGRLSGREALTLTGVEGAKDEDIAQAFLLQYYSNAQDIPPEILIAALPDDVKELTEWLKSRRGGTVSVKVPQRGEKAALLAMVKKNAEMARDEGLRKEALQERHVHDGLLGLQHALGLEHLPHRMECYDISNTQGTESVASMVVFTDGKPDKSQYRRFKIRTVEGPNDFQSMYEVIGRRFRHRELAEDNPGLKRFATLPDLVIIDGGRGQLGYAVRAMQEIGVEVPVFGLAKQHEWLFEPDSPNPIILDRDSAALKMLQHLRDEAHRFAITFHRQLRTRRNLKSLLDDVPGIGPKRKKALLRAYPNLEAIQSASVDDLGNLPGMSRTAAESVLEYLRKNQVRGSSS